MWCVLCCFFKRVNILLRPLLLKFLKFFCFSFLFSTSVDNSGTLHCTTSRTQQRKDNNYSDNISNLTKVDDGQTTKKETEPKKRMQNHVARSAILETSQTAAAQTVVQSMFTHHRGTISSFRLPYSFPHLSHIDDLVLHVHDVAAFVFSSSSSFYSANQKCWYWALPGLLSEA